MARRALGSRDRALLRSHSAVIGVDEVGRGSLAGPVVVCGARFDRIPRNPLVQDSKILSARQRELAAGQIIERASAWTVVEIWPELIDRLNILQATRVGMKTVAANLSVVGSVAVIDGVDMNCAGLSTLSIPKADAHYFAVAAASILAKVHRDGVMVELSAQYSVFQWDSNKGYGSRAHRSGLQARGSSFLHRRSFSWSPVLP